MTEFNRPDPNAAGLRRNDVDAVIADVLEHFESPAGGTRIVPADVQPLAMAIAAALQETELTGCPAVRADGHRCSLLRHEGTSHATRLPGGWLLQWPETDDGWRNRAVTPADPLQDAPQALRDLHKLEMSPEDAAQFQELLAKVRRAGANFTRGVDDVTPTMADRTVEPPTVAGRFLLGAEPEERQV